MAKKKKKKGAGEEVAPLKSHTYTVGGNVKWNRQLGKQAGSFRKKFNQQLPYDPAIHNPGEVNIYAHTRANECSYQFRLK